MYIQEKTIDDLLHNVFELILKNGQEVSCTKGENKEILGMYIQLTNPLARLSFSQTRGIAISPLGELFWYLSGDNKLDFIQYYIPQYKELSEDNICLFGGYGSRLFNKEGNINQVDLIINLLQKRQTTRKAVIQIYDAKDLKNNTNKDIPCTCTLQFFIRNNKLHLFTTMRSNDAYKGLYHDIFCFTMLQEMVARSLNIELGYYNHFVTSLHLYKKDIPKVEEYLNEGFQSSKYFMPAMPTENLIFSINKTREFEELIRKGTEVDIAAIELDSYWIDIIILLQVYSFYKTGRINKIEVLKNKITYDKFRILMQEKYNLAL